MRYKNGKGVGDINITVDNGEVKGLLGPNGAGKSLMLNCINGIYKPQQGTVSFRGREIPNITPNIMAQMGLSRTFQNLALFKRMSVLDNILVGRKLHTPSVQLLSKHLLLFGLPLSHLVFHHQ